MNKLTQLLCLLFIIFLSTQNVSCQKIQPVLITLTNGTEVYGNIVSEDSVYLIVNTIENNRVRISKELIKIIETIEEAKQRKILEKKADSIAAIQKNINNGNTYKDYNQHRMFIFPTAKSLKTGEGYLSLSELFFSFAAMGFEEIIILGGGISIYPSTNAKQIYYLSPKITPIKFDKFSFSSGIFYCSNLDISNRNNILMNGFGVIYGMGTYGDEDKSITIGLGWSFSGKDIRDKPFSIIGGEIRLKGNAKLITENWIFHSSLYAIGITGFRFIGKHFTGDLALIYPYSKPYSFVIPWFTLTYKINLLEQD